VAETLQVHNGLQHKVIDGFLSDEECDQLIAYARQKGLQRSTGWDVTKGQSAVTDYRTSENAFLGVGETELISKIEKRIADLTGTPVENGEGMQILKYGKGQYYKPHHDYFDSAFAGNSSILSNGGQRTHTVLMYLATLAPEDGGATNFPWAKVKVRPVKGRALWWPNTKPDGIVVLPITFHEAQAPLRDGVYKYVMTKWIRASKYGA
jgi:prolyl 4-hydroxylase